MGLVGSTIRREGIISCSPASQQLWNEGNNWMHTLIIDLNAVVHNAPATTWTTTATLVFNNLQEFLVHFWSFHTAMPGR